MTVQAEAKKYFDIGTECYENKDFEEAINNYTKATELYPRYKEAYNNRGYIYIELGKYEEAKKDFNQAIEIDSDYKWAYNNRGIIYSKLKKYEEAEKDYTKAIEIDSNFKMPYYNIGLIYMIFKNTNEKENINKGKKFLEKFLQIHNKENSLNTNSKVTGEEPKKLITIKNDIIFLIKSILFDNFIDDTEKLTLVELICYCYKLMGKIKFQEDNFKLTHYTKTESLKFLLKKKEDFGKLRLNNAIYMNDPQEGQIFKNLLLKYKDNESSNIFYGNIDIKNYTYLTCFCPYEKRDVLPMWIHYGNVGKGIGLVFNEKFFENQDLYYVQYIDVEKFNIDEIDENIREELKQIFDFLSQNIFTKSKNNIFLEYTNIIINYVSYFFKDKAYGYENEIRMVQFRDYESEDIIINEVSDIPKLCIEYNKEITTENCEEIIVGPKGSFEEIATYGKYVGVKQCTKSKIQYR